MNPRDHILHKLCSVAKEIISYQFFEHTCGMATTPKIRLPGYGIALNEGADKGIGNEEAFPNALLGEGYT